MDDEQPKSVPDDERLTVVGVGASAGGLEALTELLEQTSPHSARAFAVIQHMDPRHEKLSTGFAVQQDPYASGGCPRGSNPTMCA